MFSSRGFVPLFVLIVFSTGCSDPYAGRKEISGAVKFKGQSLKEGTVSFEPLDGQPTRATALLLSAGEFTIPRQTGLMPGRYLLRVSAGDGKTAVNPIDADKPPGPGGGANIISKELIPADWNVKSKQERTVAADGPNRFEIEIP
ncbi:Uncharacterized protein OS=Pirellula staleyi (strain ATCC 27377 / DSM 6068 / ICPB 4128) GN=Psta_2736 PE=4 SV=1 [Gemmata massiliana]|uniref:Carboxypeptidase regulatory-like domain-containing protein n=1 Tax=Gemmata massiliana TaxID=1210884 RepID=A0A6P2DIG0_9BACT|nr:hypothetical protein [Gemmata massiliana]VTR99828.1 Uncharacterized protein OS=Pirellula staleyi (strain ATCC 27377 / DSM 6068 / ICPB 4128) GN=Psta_2736 PE=4 SV=1 [Gemmata massiliana]